jgi:CHASE2 domain-containing sensor protein
MDVKAIGSALRAKSPWYWVRVAVIAVLGLLVSHWLAIRPPYWMVDFRLSTYQLLTSTGSRKPQFRHIDVVPISDDEFWKGELAGRRPTKRTYIAKLVRSICSGGATTIGLDFDFRSPAVDGSLANHPEYESETADLARAVNDASTHCKIILPRTLNCPNPPDGLCVAEPSVLDAYHFDPDRVSWGYINLPEDVRQVPLRRANVERGTLDSFAQAIAMADAGQQTPLLTAPRQFPYGSFITERAFQEAGVVIQAGRVLASNDHELTGIFNGNAVLVGGSWHSYAYGRGPVVDGHVTPVGPMPGIFLHANYAAAILDGRTNPPASDALGYILDVLIVALIGVFFALPISWWRRWLWIGTVALALVAVTYFFWQNVGVFLEITIPALLLLIHSLFDEYMKMREELTMLRTEVADLRKRAAAG